MIELKFVPFQILFCLTSIVRVTDEVGSILKNDGLV